MKFETQTVLVSHVADKQNFQYFKIKYIFFNCKIIKTKHNILNIPVVVFLGRPKPGFLNNGGHGMLTRGPQVQDFFTIINCLWTIDAFMKQLKD